MNASAGTSVQGSKRLKKRWFACFGANSLAISILLHILFGVGATFLIVEHFQKKHINFHATEPPTQHTEVEHKVELAKRNNVESAPPDIKRIVTTDVSSITLPEPPDVPNDDATPSAMAGIDGVMGLGLGSGSGKGGNGGGGGNPPFGAPDGTGLEGYLYDLKQTSDKKPTGMNIRQYYALLTKYISQGWDESMLEPYYKSKTPIYTDSYAISTRPSEEAPKAFGVEKEVQAGLWVIHYHARVEAPQEGEYRLAGFADNVLMVKISGETVLDAGFEPSPLSDKAIFYQTLPYAFPTYIPWTARHADAHLKIGPTFHLDAADPVDMDVLIGDDGGHCNFFLLIEREGNTYEMTPDGTPKLPFFQLGTGPAPTFQNSEEHPPYSTTPEPWTGAP